MTRQHRLRMVSALAGLALVRFMVPAPALASGPRAMAVPICGEAGHVLLLPIAPPRDGRSGPRKSGGETPAPCCAICHSAMRKRAGAGSCCDDGSDGGENNDDGR
jgi:hypothetical protein